VVKTEISERTKTSFSDAIYMYDKMFLNNFEKKSAKLFTIYKFFIVCCLMVNKTVDKGSTKFCSNFVFSKENGFNWKTCLSVYGLVV
jgi:hypothetical protein